MRYLTLKKNGTWYFRFQIPIRFRSYFGNKIELKRSIGQVDRKTAYLQSLKLQLQVKEQIAQIESAMGFVEPENGQVRPTKPLTVKLPKTPSITHNSFISDTNVSYEQDTDIVNYARLATKHNATKKVVEPIALQSTEKSLDEIKSLLVAQTIKPKIDAYEVLKGFIEHKRTEKLTKLKGKTPKRNDFKNIRSYEFTFTVVHELIGKNDLNAIDITDILSAKSYLQDFPILPSGGRKDLRFQNKDAKTVIELNEAIGYPTISENTVGRYMQRVSTIYRWAVKYTPLQQNLFEGIGKRIEQIDIDKVAPFTSGELRRIFSTTTYRTAEVKTFNQQNLNYQYWYCLIAATTGARPSEVAQLQVADVKCSEGIHYFDINDFEESKRLKNRNSRRMVPIHKKLINLGFLKFIESRDPNELLFSELDETEATNRYSAVFSWFTREFSVPMNLADQNKTCSSFRHTFIDKFKQAGIADQICGSIVGHVDESITYRNYGSIISLEVKQEYINNIDFGDVFNNVARYQMPQD